MPAKGDQKKNTKKVGAKPKKAGGKVKKVGAKPVKKVGVKKTAGSVEKGARHTTRGLKAVRDMKKLREESDHGDIFMLRTAPIERITRLILAKYVPQQLGFFQTKDNVDKDVQWRVAQSATDTLQTALEAYLSDLLQGACKVAIAAGRTTLFAKDVEVARDLKGASVNKSSCSFASKIIEDLAGEEDFSTAGIRRLALRAGILAISKKAETYTVIRMTGIAYLYKLVTGAAIAVASDSVEQLAGTKDAASVMSKQTREGSLAQQKMLRRTIKAKDVILSAKLQNINLYATANVHRYTTVKGVSKKEGAEEKPKVKRIAKRTNKGKAAPKADDAMVVVQPTSIEAIDE